MILASLMKPRKCAATLSYRSDAPPLLALGEEVFNAPVLFVGDAIVAVRVFAVAAR